MLSLFKSFFAKSSIISITCYLNYSLSTFTFPNRSKTVWLLMLSSDRGALFIDSLLSPSDSEDSLSNPTFCEKISEFYRRRRPLLTMESITVESPSMTTSSKTIDPLMLQLGEILQLAPIWLFKICTEAHISVASPRKVLRTLHDIAFEKFTP